MNLVGPLANPAGVTRQVVGVADAHRAPLVASALAQLGAEHAMIVHAAVGMDEVSPAGVTRVWEVRDGAVDRWELDPTHYQLHCPDLDGVAGGVPGENAARIEGLLDGDGPAALRCAVLLNAAAALYGSGRGWSLEEAVSRATDALASGAGKRVLGELRKASVG
jgi:anthranilate phosphoribosyltransferase